MYAAHMSNDVAFIEASPLVIFCCSTLQVKLREAILKLIQLPRMHCVYLSTHSPEYMQMQLLEQSKLCLR